MKGITPNLWINGNAKEVVDFYVSTFPDSEVLSTQYYPKTAEEGLADFQLDMAGKPLVIEFVLGGQKFAAINAGPEFTFNQSMSFFVNFDPSRDDEAREHLDELWEQLADGGEVMMALDEYPYSKRYGWIKDRYGLSWQLMLVEPVGTLPFIVPSLLFAGKNVNNSKKAIEYYLSVFKDSKEGMLATYEQDTGPAKAGSLMYGDFKLGDQWFAAMDAGVEMDATFNESVSFSIACDDQAEIDYFWEKLSKVPESEQCGWCKDQFGLSWQIIPANMGELMKRPDAYVHMMNMHKLVIADF